MFGKQEAGKWLQKSKNIASKKLKKDPTDYRAFLSKRECEKFFRSKYFGIICDLDPEKLMMKIVEIYV